MQLRKMTVDEKLKLVKEHCEEQESCYECPWGQLGYDHCFIAVRAVVDEVDKKLTTMLKDYEF